VQRKEKGIERVLIGPDELKARIEALATEIDSWYPERTPVMVGVLNGAALFMTDLMKSMGSPVVVDYMAVSSYGASTQSSGIVQILKDLSQSIEGRDLLVVEDIVDSGLTLRYLKRNLLARNPASLEVCALLLREGAADGASLKYVGFEMPPDFVIGYGLDVAERYRNLPYICAYNEEV
jgi:hypoxanthine phosphoribosyltransferase